MYVNRWQDRFLKLLNEKRSISSKTRMICIYLFILFVRPAGRGRRLKQSSASVCLINVVYLATYMVRIESISLLMKIKVSSVKPGSRLSHFVNCSLIYRKLAKTLVQSLPVSSVMAWSAQKIFKMTLSFKKVKNFWFMRKLTVIICH